MTKRTTHDVAFAAAELADARAGLQRIPLGKRQEAAVGDILDRLAGAQARLDRQLPERPGVPVSAAAAYLQVSQPTVRVWAKRGLLMPLDGSKPLLIDLASLRHLAQLIGELRERGHDGDWMRALVDHVHDAGALADADVRQGLKELRRGDLKPA